MSVLEGRDPGVEGFGGSWGKKGLKHMAVLVQDVEDQAIVLLEADGRIATWNRGASRLTGFAADDVLGEAVDLLYSTEDRRRRRPDGDLAAAAQDGSCETDGWLSRQDGSRFWAQTSITALRDPSGELVGYGLVTRDRTERREAEERLRRSHRRLQRSNADLERFALVAAHDLRAPLGSAEALLDVLQRRDGERLSAEGAAAVEAVKASLARAQELISDLLGCARAEERGAGFTAVPLADSVSRVLTDLAPLVEQHNAVVTTAVPASASVLAEAAGLDVVLRNLVTNALKFGARDGVQVHVEAERRRDVVVLRVYDNGDGIGRADHERIFGAFERLPAAGGLPGSGLGLSICSRLVERFGGRIGVRSAPGEGASFWVELPAA